MFSLQHICGIYAADMPQSKISKRGTMLTYTASGILAAYYMQVAVYICGQQYSELPIFGCCCLYAASCIQYAASGIQVINFTYHHLYAASCIVLDQCPNHSMYTSNIQAHIIQKGSWLSEFILCLDTKYRLNSSSLKQQQALSSNMNANFEVFKAFVHHNLCGLKCIMSVERLVFSAIYFLTQLRQEFVNVHGFVIFQQYMTQLTTLMVKMH